MKKLWQGGWMVVLALVFAMAIALFSGIRPSAFGGSVDEARSTGGPHYTVIETQGSNLLVTDNASNKLYFYTVDKDKPIGSPLKLRASLDLTRVGEKTINITDHLGRVGHQHDADRVAPPRVLHKLHRERLGLLEPGHLAGRIGHAQRAVEHEHPVRTPAC